MFKTGLKDSVLENSVPVQLSFPKSMHANLTEGRSLNRTGLKAGERSPRTSVVPDILHFNQSDSALPPPASASKGAPEGLGKITRFLLTESQPAACIAQVRLGVDRHSCKLQ